MLKHRDSSAPPNTATVETGAHTQQRMIQCAQFSHSVENIQPRKESKGTACIGNLPDDILVCGVVQKILVQLEGRHLVCSQQAWLGKSKKQAYAFQQSNGSLLRQQPGARDMAWLEAQYKQSHASINSFCQSSMYLHEAAEEASVLSGCQVDGSKSPSLRCSGHEIVHFGFRQNPKSQPHQCILFSMHHLLEQDLMKGAH